MSSFRGVRLLTSIVIATVIAAVIAAMIVIGPPSRQRNLKLDQRRIQDLRDIERATNTYWQRRKTLPPDLATLSREPGLRPPMADPERGSPYEFKVTGVGSFHVCAVFSLDSEDDSNSWSYSHTGSWAHGAGRQCFELSITATP
jgi:type II secretory pathway pseudopilin PulG